MAHFISLDEVDGLTPLEWCGGKVGAQWEQVQAQLGRRAPDTAPLFAEPVWSSGDDSGISWYTVHEGEPVPYSALSGGEREQAASALRSVLDELRPLLRDPEFGPLLGHALLVPDLEDVLLVGGRPVLRNWGCVVAGTSPADAWRAGLGRFAPPDWPVPWEMAGTGLAETASVRGVLVPPQVAWWRRPAVAVPAMLLLVLASAGGSWIGWRQSMPRLTPEQQAEEAQTILRQPIVDERIEAFGTALKNGLCTAEAADTAPLSPEAAGGVAAGAVATVLVPGLAMPGRGNAVFVSRDQLIVPEAVLAGITDQPIFVESPGALGTFLAERAKASPRGGLALLHALQPVRWSAPVAVAPGLLPATGYSTAALPGYVNTRDSSFIELQKGLLSEGPRAVLDAGMLDEKPGALPTARLPPQSDGAPVVDACGRLIGLGTQAGTLPASPTLALLEAKPGGPCLALPGFVPAPEPAK